MVATDASFARLHGMNDPYYQPSLDMPKYKEKWKKDQTYDDYEEDEAFDQRRSKKG